MLIFCQVKILFRFKLNDCRLFLLVPVILLSRVKPIKLSSLRASLRPKSVIKAFYPHRPSIHHSLIHPHQLRFGLVIAFSLSPFGLWLPAFTAFAHSHFRSLRFRLLFLLVFFVIPPFFGSLNPETRKLELASKRRGCYENGSKARAFFRSLRASGD